MYAQKCQMLIEDGTTLPGLGYGVYAILESIELAIGR